MGALKSSPLSNFSIDEKKIYYRNDILPEHLQPVNGLYNVYFVLTQRQLGHWCGGHSCVAP